MTRFPIDDYYVTLDIGGSSVKAALLNSTYEVIANSFTNTPIDSNGPPKQIIDTIVTIIAGKLSLAKTLREIKAIGISFPECSDYEQGIIAVMPDKFRNSGGICLRDEIIKGLKLPNDFYIVFEEDSITFLKGAVRQGKSKIFNRIIGLTLGTGLGSAFMIGGKIIRNATDIPPDGELGCLQYEEGIIEDIISIKGILNIYRQITGEERKDVKDLAEKARKGEANAIRTFKEFGWTMGQIIRPYVENFKTECIIIGGQIAKSFDFFEESLSLKLIGVPSLKEIMQAESIDFCPFFGLLNTIENSIRDDNCKENI